MWTVSYQITNMGMFEWIETGRFSIHEHALGAARELFRDFAQEEIINIRIRRI